MNRIARILLFTMISAAIVGCSSGPKLVPVDGRVTLEGKPVKQMLINFQPVGTTEGNGAHAMTDEDGKFTLADMRGGTGAHIGEYKVTFYPPLNRKVPEGDPSDVVNSGRGSGIPPMYLDVDKTPLKVSIPDGGGTAEVVLTASGKDASIKFQPKAK